jgi:hypothetical protein
MVAQEWKEVQRIAPDLLLPGVHEQLRKTMVAGGMKRRGSAVLMFWIRYSTSV